MFRVEEHATNHIGSKPIMIVFQHTMLKVTAGLIKFHKMQSRREPLSENEPTRQTQICPFPPSFFYHKIFLPFKAEYMRDLSHPRWMQLKALLFLLIGL